MAGDVYSQPPYVGRGGWSRYTGAAARMHRAAIESMFGLHQGAQHLHLRPCLPLHWGRAELHLRRGGRSLRFILRRAGSARAGDGCPARGDSVVAGSGPGLAHHDGRR
jgi:cyclic beta-1,2-glucan synthetase